MATPVSDALPQPKRYKVSAKWLFGIAGATLLFPVLMVFVIFPWLSEPAFQSVSEIDTSEIDVLRVQLLNHPQGKEDVGPVEMNSADFAKLFAALGPVEEVKELPAVVWLGEYRVRFRDGRRGTIRLYQKEKYDDKQKPSVPSSPRIIWMKIGSNYYRAGEVLPLFEVARDCATRGKFQR